MDDIAFKLVPKEETYNGEEGWAVKDLYLRKDDMIIGLHSIGYPEPYTFTLHELDGSVKDITTNFYAVESWGNEYDENHNMLGRGSFRINYWSIEREADEFIKEGWEVFEGPKKQTKELV